MPWPQKYPLMKVLDLSSEKSLQVLALKMLVHPKCSFSEDIFRQAHFYPFIQTLFNKSLRYVLNFGCVFPIVVVSMLPHVKFGPNDHWDDAPHCT